MSFPKLEHCLVCEIVRPEAGGKLSLLGFYGLAPNVEISLQNIDVPMASLAFVFVGGEYAPKDGESFQVGLKIIGPEKSNSTIIETPASPMSFPKAAKRTFLGSGIANLRFPTFGQYHVVLSVDGNSQYDQTFDISQAQKTPD